MDRLGCVALYLFAFVCNGEERHCSRYHYEEQTLAKIVRLEHRLELLEARTKTEGLETIFTCPNAWIRYKDSCYLFPDGSVNFEDAEILCVQFGSHLVHIESETENTFLKNLLRDLKDSDYWTGLTKDSSGKWKWYGTDNEASFKDWNDHSPNNVAGIQDCVFLQLYHDFQWNDIACSSNYKAICERKIERGLNKQEHM